MKSVTSNSERTIEKSECPMDGAGLLNLDHLLCEKSVNGKLRTYAKAVLTPGSAVGYHPHEGECEIYYFLSGEGMYNDNGTEVKVGAGHVTYTPSGSAHGIKNIGSSDLEFIALILKD